MALLNPLLIPILAALGLFTPDGQGGSSDAGGGSNAGGASGDDKGGGSTGGGTGGNAGQGGGTGSSGANAGAAAGGTAAGGDDKAKAKGDGGQEPPAQQGTSLEDVQKLQRELNEARQQAGQYRAAGIQAIAQALGIELPKQKGEEGQEAAISQLQTEITSLRTEARAGAIDAAFERTVGKLGARPVLTRRYIDGQLKDLDPKADDFSTKLEQIVQAAIDEEPALKATQAAQRSGGEFNGDGGNNDQESLSVDELRKKRGEWRSVTSQ